MEMELFGAMEKFLPLAFPGVAQGRERILWPAFRAGFVSFSGDFLRRLLGRRDLAPASPIRTDRPDRRQLTNHLGLIRR
jgi:hypothetical protein